MWQRVQHWQSYTFHCTFILYTLLNGWNKLWYWNVKCTLLHRSGPRLLVSRFVFVETAWSIHQPKHKHKIYRHHPWTKYRCLHYMCFAMHFTLIVQMCAALGPRSWPSVDCPPKESWWTRQPPQNLVDSSDSFLSFTLSPSPASSELAACTEGPPAGHLGPSLAPSVEVLRNGNSSKIYTHQCNGRQFAIMAVCQHGVRVGSGESKKGEREFGTCMKGTKPRTGSLRVLMPPMFPQPSGTGFWNGDGVSYLRLLCSLPRTVLTGGSSSSWCMLTQTP